MLSINQLLKYFTPKRGPKRLQERLDAFVTKEGRALDGLFADAGLNSRLDGTRIYASQIAGYLHYYIKREDMVSKISSLCDDISAVMTEIRGDATEVKINKTMLYIDAPFPFERRHLMWDDIDFGRLNPHQMVIGRDYSGTSPMQVVIDYRERATSNMLLSGVTGSGKTTALTSSLVSLAWSTSPQDAQIILIDPKGSEILQPLRDLPHVSLHITTDESIAAIASVKAELDRRKTQGDKRKIYLVVEELTELFSEAGMQEKLLTKQLTSIASMGREKNIRVIACTQKPHIKVVDTVLRASLPMKLAGMTNTKEESRVATGIDGVGCEFLPGKGSFYFLHDAAPRRVQSFYLPDEELPRVIDQIIQKWSHVSPYRIEPMTAQQAAELPELPSGVTIEQLFTIAGTFGYGQIFNHDGIKRGKRIQLIRTAYGEDATDNGHISKWADHAIPYLRDYWTEIAEALEAQS